MSHPNDETLLLALLNTTPTINSQPTDQLADPRTATTTLRAWGGTGTNTELTIIRAARTDLQTVARAQEPPTILTPHLATLTQIPRIDHNRLTWQLDTSPDRLLTARAVLAFFTLNDHHPGRLRPCQNPTCQLFLIDHSHPGTARWCSMTTCGNRMKARRYRTRNTQRKTHELAVPPV